MTLNIYCENVLKTELAKSDYDGKTADQGWAWLMLPTTTNNNVDTNLLLTPVVAAKAIGPGKANALAIKIKAALPAIADSLMTAGVNVSDAVTRGFLNSLVDGVDITQDDINVLLALGTRTVTTTTPRRFEMRFDPTVWEHVSQFGLVGDNNDPAISGFPNNLEREDFDAAWVEAGRSL